MARMSLKITILGAICLAHGASGKVIGEDDRREPELTETELVASLGLIVCSRIVDGRFRRSAGTGTIVGSRRTILTSAHVLIDEAGRQGQQVRFDAPRDCVFRQFDATGRAGAEVGFVHAELGAFWRNAGVPNQDWAVLRTASALPDSALVLPFAANDNAIEDLEGLEIRMLAFHADVRDARRIPLISEGRLFGTDYGGFFRLAHTADSGRMSSGAAIVHRTGTGQHVVVGVNRSSANLRDFNLAVPLSAELVAALSSSAFGQVPPRSQQLASLSR